jgi:hypothetical protein
MRARNSLRAAIEAPFVQRWFPPQRQETLLGCQQIQQFLGFVLHTQEMEIHLPKNKSLKIRKDMTTSYVGRILSIRKLTAIAGLCQSTRTAVFPARHHTWQLVSQVHEGLNDPRNLHRSWDWTVTISEASKQSAQWWFTELEE